MLYLMFKDLTVLCILFQPSVQLSFLYCSSDGAVYLHKVLCVCKADQRKYPDPKEKSHGQALASPRLWLMHSNFTSLLQAGTQGFLRCLTVQPYLLPRFGEAQMMHKAFVNLLQLFLGQLKILSLNPPSKCLYMDCTHGF